MTRKTFVRTTSFVIKEAHQYAPPRRARSDAPYLRWSKWPFPKAKTRFSGATMTFYGAAVPNGIAVKLQSVSRKRTGAPVKLQSRTILTHGDVVELQSGVILIHGVDE
jgi:hypothetical protein